MAGFFNKIKSASTVCLSLLFCTIIHLSVFICDDNTKSIAMCPRGTGIVRAEII